MAIKVLSGIAITRRLTSGNVIINFSDHSVSGDLSDDEVRHRRTIGLSGRFEQTPCKVVSLREIKVHETDEPFPTGRSEIDSFRINDSEINRDRLQINWQATGSSRIEEVSYLVIGEISDQR